MPRIREMLRGLFGFEPTACGNVDECVALGAALFSLKGASVQEVCNHSYGTLAMLEDAATGMKLRQFHRHPKEHAHPLQQANVLHFRR